MDHRKAHILEEKERTEDIKIEENVTFSQMYLSDSVLSGLESAKFIWPSPIQLSAIPLGRCGLDLVVQAKSGTGKTCVFAVVALEMISLAAKTTQVLVIAPTREIAVQISQVIDTIGSKMPELRTFPFIGGLSVINDKSNLSCCHIAVGTPGRLLQLIELGFLQVNNVRLLVLDEADQLLSGQFQTSIMKIVSSLPLNKQVLALSATYPEEVSSIVNKIMRSPSYVRLDRETPSLLGVNQFVRHIPYHPQPHHRIKAKQNELLEILRCVTFNQCLIFSNSQMRAESLSTYLKQSKWPVAYLSGNQAQKDRLKAFEDLCSYKIRVLVSTDVSARGIDSEHVNLVINLDIPWEHSTYLHRVGRAGRFGSYGTAISLVCDGEEWESMKAISSLANVKLKIISENWNPEMKLNLDSCYESLEQFDEEDLDSWLKYKSCRTKAESKKNLKTQKPCKISADPPGKSKQKANGTLSLEEYFKNSLDTLNAISSTEVPRAKDETSLDVLNLGQKFNQIKLSHSDMLELCKEKGYLPSNDLSDCILDLESISIRDPCIPELKNLNNFINGLLEEQTPDIKFSGEENTISLLDGVIQGRDFTSEKKKHPDQLAKISVKASASVSATNNDTSFVNGAASPLEMSSSNKNSLHKSPQLSAHSSSHKDICETTGYGQWVSVKKKVDQKQCVFKQPKRDINSCSRNLRQSLKKSEVLSDHSIMNSCSDNGFNNHYQSYYSSAGAYMHSAQKFASMMEYTRTMGQMSACIARNYQKDKKKQSNPSRKHKHKC